MRGTRTTTVFVDANAWFSRTLRDWLGMLYTRPTTRRSDVRLTWSHEVPTTRESVKPHHLHHSEMIWASCLASCGSLL